MSHSNIITRLILSCIICLALGSAAQAQKRGQPSAWGVPQVFSDLSYGNQSGDVGGMEVILFPGDGQMWATVMIAEGVPHDPVLVKVTVKGSNIEFSLP